MERDYRRLMQQGGVGVNRGGGEIKKGGLGYEL